MDGVISQNVEVSGDVVNLSKVGTYTVTYNCKMRPATPRPLDRTVVVRQTSCPRCTIHGALSLVHEASFSYAALVPRAPMTWTASSKPSCQTPLTSSAPVHTRLRTALATARPVQRRVKTTGGQHTCLNNNVEYEREVKIEDTSSLFSV